MTPPEGVEVDWLHRQPQASAFVDQTSKRIFQLIPAAVGLQSHRARYFHEGLSGIFGLRDNLSGRNLGITKGVALVKEIFAAPRQLVEEEFSEPLRHIETPGATLRELRPVDFGLTSFFSDRAPHLFRVFKTHPAGLNQKFHQLFLEDEQSRVFWRSPGHRAF